MAHSSTKLGSRLGGWHGRKKPPRWAVSGGGAKTRWVRARVRFRRVVVADLECVCRVWIPAQLAMGQEPKAPCQFA